MKSIHSIFCEAFKQIEAEKQEESILDYPQVDLDSSVWNKKKNGTYELTKEASNSVKNLVEYIIKSCKLKNPTVRIVGSITSNTYSSDSDIDVHFSADNITEENSDEMNKTMRAEFDENWCDMHTDIMRIGTHKLEVYAQWNVFQDMQSCGVYDFLKKEWISGPEFRDAGYDPYAEYYEKGIKHLDGLYEDMEKIVLKAGETAKVILESQMSKDKEFRSKLESELNNCIENSAKILASLRDARKISSTPKSKEEAFKNRDSEEWKISDASFKMLDKLGYLAILKGIADIKSSEEREVNKMAEIVIDTIKTNIFGKATTEK